MAALRLDWDSTSFLAGRGNPHAIGAPRAILESYAAQSWPRQREQELSGQCETIPSWEQTHHLW
jgi:hypothetical protein